MNDIIFWVIAAVILALGVYTNYSNWKMYIKANEAKKTFLKNHKDSETVKTNPLRAWVFALLAIVCLVIGFFLTTMDESQMTSSTKWSQALVYMGLAIFCVAMVPEARMDAIIVSCPDGFMYADQYIRYKSITDIETTGSIFKSAMITFTGNKQEVIPKSVAKWADPKWEEYKANRKAARKKGKGRMEAR